MLLIMAQVDDAPGELVQDVVERLQRVGSRNVHILSSLAKKGRPGHVLLIDVPEQHEDDVALLLGSELGVWGYRVLESRHRHFDIELNSTPLQVRVGDLLLTFDLSWKRIEKQGRLLAVKAEHDHLAQIRDALEDNGVHVALRWLRTHLEQQLAEDPLISPLHLAF
jgi:pyridinium-3,5-bisthiocarboxylic acid mononucleotide nickel chelatase